MNMAKLRRNAGRSAAPRKAKAPVKKPKARPASKKPAPARTKARPAARKAPTSAAPLAKGRQRPAPPAAPVRRSTYADAVALYERGLHALQARRYQEAAATLRRVISGYPEEIELHERARLYIRVCERQITPPDATPKTPSEQIYAATLALNAGQIDQAQALLAAVVHQHKDNDVAEYMLGLTLAAKGDQAGAIAHLARALELNPENRELLRKEPDLEALRQTEGLQAVLTAPPATGRKDKRSQPRTRR
jgi:tetratricopeptide (TPR) repeat protein